MQDPKTTLPQNYKDLPATGRAKPMPEHPYCELDGVTHINADNRGRTRLGQLMSPLAQTPILHPEFGPFHSMEGLWAYIRSEEADDQLRYSYGMLSRHLNRKAKTRFVPNFRELILDALVMKIEQNRELMELVIRNDLPYESYFIHQGVESGSTLKINTKSSSWLVPTMEEAARYIKAGTRPPKPDYKLAARLP